MFDVVTMGEIMVQLNPVTEGPLRHVVYFEKHAAGAEANFAVGMTRMGFAAGYITRVGEDEFGRYILSFLRGEGVDVSRVVVDKEAPTGIYFIQRGYPVPGKSSVLYYRKGSAASRLCPEDLDSEYMGQTRLFHLTGITPALSETCREASYEAIKIARKGNIMISLDTNIRLRLWKAEKARETLLPMIEKATILLTDPQDSQILIGESDPERAANSFLDTGPSTVVVKLAEEGALAATREKMVTKRAFKVPVVDMIGAGDAFAAGFVASILKGWSLDRALEVANAAGALVVTVRGDIENLPSMEEVERFLAFQRKEKVDFR